MKKEILVAMEDLEITALEDEDLASVTGGCNSGSTGCTSMFACSSTDVASAAADANTNTFGATCPETKSSGTASGTG